MDIFNSKSFKKNVTSFLLFSAHPRPDISNRENLSEFCITWLSLTKSLRPRGKGTCHLMYHKHSPDTKKRVPWLRAPTGLRGVEEKIFPKRQLGCCTEEGRNGEQAKTTDVYYWHHTHEQILSTFDGFFWQTKCVFLVFSSTTMLNITL